MELTKEEIQTIINVLGQVQVPVVSKQADILRALIEKLKAMSDEIT